MIQEENMNKLKQWWYEHDDIEIVLFACIWGSFGFMGYHAVVGIVDKFF